MQSGKVKDAQHKAQYRIPAELASWLREKAEQNTRTINGELIARLKESRQREEQEASHAP